MQDNFDLGIKPAAHNAGFLCGERIDTEAFTGDILETVKAKIEYCERNYCRYNS